MVSSPVLTSEETVRWLRLDEDHADIGQAVKALHRLVQEGRLRPLRVGRTYKFTLGELERFVATEVERGTASPSANGSGDVVRGESGVRAHQKAHQRG